MCSVLTCKHISFHSKALVTLLRTCLKPRLRSIFSKLQPFFNEAFMWMILRISDKTDSEPLMSIAWLLSGESTHCLKYNSVWTASLPKACLCPLSSLVGTEQALFKERL